jgi:ribosomal-protein-alanine N-acetyltransferase
MSVDRVSIPLSTKLNGGRVVLRPPRTTDIGALRNLLRTNADHLRPWSPAPAQGVNPLSLTELSRSIARQRHDWKRDLAYVFLMAAAREHGEPLIGRVALTSVTRGPFQNTYLGYWIDADHQSRGLTSEAVDVALGFVFGSLSLHRVQAAVMPHNVASRQILTKRGFREEGLARRYLRIAGSWEDHVLYGLTREDWLSPSWGASAADPENLRTHFPSEADR